MFLSVYVLLSLLRIWSDMALTHTLTVLVKVLCRNDAPILLSGFPFRADLGSGKLTRSGPKRDFERPICLF